MKILQSFCFLAFAITTQVLTAAPEVFPHPREIQDTSAKAGLSSASQIIGAESADPSVLGLLKKILNPSSEGGSITRIIMGDRSNPALATFLAGVPELSGAYRLQVNTDAITLAGHDGRGTFYGVQTLGQLIGHSGKSGQVPMVDIRDWPDVACRGIVEGFYGTPWTHANRLSLITFFGKYKLNTYIYGPKDDPFHSSPNWRKPYPPAEAARIRELAETCVRNHVDFVWAIHPGKDIHWTEDDFNAVMGKFTAMQALGVRSFAVFFDDISGEGAKAENQAALLNRLSTEFVAKNPGIGPLILCPTEYNKAWANPKPGGYLDILGTKLDPSIRVMWTGNSVVADLDRQSMEWINARLKRKAYVWWNYPVTDYVRNHLLMGRVYGNGTDLADAYGGFVSNPMEHAEASKVALFGVADYTWNMAKYQPDEAWRAAIRAVLPGAANEFEVFCRHNADLGPNGHGYRRAESVEFATVAETYLDVLRAGMPGDDKSVRVELEQIHKAPAAIRKSSNNPELLAEISPWIDAFEQLGRAGVAGLDARKSITTGRIEETWGHLAEANDALNRMGEIDRTCNRNPYQPGIRTGSLVVAPLVKEIVETTSAQFYSSISGRPVFHPTGITSAKESASLPMMLDGKEETFFYCKEIQQAGDWFGVDLGADQDVRRVVLVQGRNDDDHDRVHDGVLEGLREGRWEVIARVKNTRVDVALDPPHQYRSVRLRVVRAGSESKADLWTAIREFTLNPKAGPVVRSEVAAFAAQPVRVDDKEIAVVPVYEVRTLPAGKSIVLWLPDAAACERIEVDLKVQGVAKSIVLEATADGKTWTELPQDVNGTLMTATPDMPVSAVRLRNSPAADMEITLSKFALIRTVPLGEGQNDALEDGKLETTALIKLDGHTIVRHLSRQAAAEVVVLVPPMSGKTARLMAMTGKQEHLLGVVRGGVNRYPLPQGTTGIRFATDGTSSTLPVTECVWISR